MAEAEEKISVVDAESKTDVGASESKTDGGETVRFEVKKWNAVALGVGHQGRQLRHLQKRNHGSMYVLECTRMCLKCAGNMLEKICV